MKYEEYVSRAEAALAKLRGIPIYDGWVSLSSVVGGWMSYSETGHPLPEKHAFDLHYNDDFRAACHRACRSNGV